jgi:hypothetical protein
MLTSIDEHVNADTKLRLMESCGRACARAGAKASIEPCRGDLEGFLGVLRGWVGPDAVERHGKTVTVTYSRCYCGLQAEVPRRLAEVYCACSCGWLKEMFESVVEDPVDVVLETSIKRGGDSCRFVVTL